jgi:hypothetical protein
MGGGGVLPGVRIKLNKMETTIEQACASVNWRWKKWDVRADGRVFWEYRKDRINSERWVTWGTALERKNYQKSYREIPENKNRAKTYLKAYRENPENKDHLKNYTKTQKYKDYQGSYIKSKRLNDPIFAIKQRVRIRVLSFLRRNGHSKPSKTQDMLGCDWSHLKAHLESQFTEGMSWANRNLWHIDHIIPLASAKSAEEVVKLSHYTNLQPLWAKDNMRKGASVS